MRLDPFSGRCFNRLCWVSYLWFGRSGSSVRQTASSSPASSGTDSRPLRWRSTRNLPRTGPSLRRRISPHPPTRQTSVPLHPSFHRDFQPFLRAKSDEQAATKVADSRRKWDWGRGGTQPRGLPLGPHAHISCSTTHNYMCSSVTRIDWSQPSMLLPYPPKEPHFCQ